MQNLIVISRILWWPSVMKNWRFYSNCFSVRPHTLGDSRGPWEVIYWISSVQFCLRGNVWWRPSCLVLSSDSVCAYKIERNSGHEVRCEGPSTAYLGGKSLLANLLSSRDKFCSVSSLVQRAEVQKVSSRKPGNSTGHWVFQARISLLLFRTTASRDQFSTAT